MALDLTPLTLTPLTATPTTEGARTIGTTGDLTVATDTDASGAGDLIFSTAGVERARLLATGSGSGFLTPRFDYRKRKWLPENHNATMIETFQSGHGWTELNAASGSGGPGVNLNYTTIQSPWSDRCIRMVNGSVGTEEVSKGSYVLDMTGKTLLVWMRYPGVVGFSNPVVQVRLGDAAMTNYYTGTSAPYAAGNIAPSNSEWVCHEFFIPEMTLTGTLALGSITRIGVGLQASGGGQIGLLGAIATKPTSATYTNGVISISLDDSSATDYTLARQTLGKYNLPATCYLIADLVGTTGPTVAQYLELQDSLGWEIGGHAYTLANHNTRLENLSATACDNELRALKEWLLDNGFLGEQFASPGGTASLTVIANVLKYFSSHRNAGQPAAFGSTQSAPPVTPRMLAGATFDATNAPIATCQALVDKVKAAKSWGIFNIHSISSGASSGLVMSQANLDTLCAYIVAQGVACRTVSRVMQEVGLAY